MVQTIVVVQVAVLHGFAEYHSEAGDKGSLTKAASSLVSQVLKAVVISSLEWLTGAGLTAVVKAMAPQDRTEKTVESCILTERLKRGRGLERCESRERSRRLRIPNPRPVRLLYIVCSPSSRDVPCGSLPVKRDASRLRSRRTDRSSECLREKLTTSERTPISRGMNQTPIQQILRKLCPVRERRNAARDQNCRRWDRKEGGKRAPSPKPSRRPNQHGKDETDAIVEPRELCGDKQKPQIDILKPEEVIKYPCQD